MENGSPDFETLLTRCRANLQQGQDPFAGLSVHPLYEPLDGSTYIFGDRHGGGGVGGIHRLEALNFDALANSGVR